MKTTEIMSLPLPETEEHTISRQAEKTILRIAEKMDIVVIGPGLTTHNETAQLVKNLIANLSVPIVADADAINAIELSYIKFTRSPLIITPHPGEMARLLDISTNEIQANRLEAVQKTAETCNTYIVLKGDRTLIGDPQGNVFINPTGNPGMATAGTGDVLTGMIAGLLAQGLNPVQACNLGVYLHGVAGDIAAGDKGEMCLMAGDLLNNIPCALSKLVN